MSRARAARLALGALWLATLGACGGVKPYERGALAKRKMQIDPSPEATLLQNHVYDYREGSAGATGAVGGGCGCN